MECLLIVPTKAMVMELKVGDLAPNAFGKLAEVVAIFAKRQDIEGKWFVCYYTKQGENAEMSMSMKEGELVRHAGASRFFDSVQLDNIERWMKKHA